MCADCWLDGWGVSGLISLPSPHPIYPGSGSHVSVYISLDLSSSSGWFGIHFFVVIVEIYVADFAAVFWDEAVFNSELSDSQVKTQIIPSSDSRRANISSEPVWCLFQFLAVQSGVWGRGQKKSSVSILFHPPSSCHPGSWSHTGRPFSWPLSQAQWRRTEAALHQRKHHALAYQRFGAEPEPGNASLSSARI